MKLHEPMFSADHPGGNITVEKVEGDRVWLSPDFRHMQEGQTWFYWNFRAQNRRPVRVVFSHRNQIGAHGPAISTDGGVSWKWLGHDGVREHPISEHLIECAFEIPAIPEEADVRYAFCPQYQQSDWECWVKRHEIHPSLEVSELCRSRNGRKVELLKIRDTGVLPPHGTIWLTARHHCCEAMGSYALEGFLEAVLSADEVGRQFRTHWEVVAMPFMDKDGVEEGDQGKLRHPHDHNRDYNEQPIYPEVAAAMRFGLTRRHRIAAFLDLHCPMVHGPWDNRFYLVGSPFPAAAARQNAFMERFGETCSGDIRMHGDGVLDFGQAWNTHSNFSAGKCATLWAGETFPEADLIASFEVPYANAEGVEVNPETARALGRDLAATLLCHVKDINLVKQHA